MLDLIIWNRKVFRKMDLALDNRLSLPYHKTKPNQTKQLRLELVFKLWLGTSKELKYEDH